MSDTREIIYNSPSMGRVRLRRTGGEDGATRRFLGLDVLEAHFIDRVVKGDRLVTDQFWLAPPDFDAIARELVTWTKYAPPIDPLARFADDQLRAECERRGVGETYKQQMEIMQCEVAQLTKRLDGKQSVLWEFRRMCERFGIPDGVDELAWLPACLSRLAEYENQSSARKREAATLFGVDKNLNVGDVRVAAVMKSMCETGPGIVGVKVEKDTAHYVDPTDLLCEDV